MIKRFGFCLIVILLVSCSTTNKKQVNDKKSQQEQEYWTDSKELVLDCVYEEGYAWSRILQKCILSSEEGIMLKAINTNDSAYFIMSADQTRCEFFSSDPSELSLIYIQEKKNSNVWNIEDESLLYIKTIKEHHTWNNRSTSQVRLINKKVEVTNDKKVVFREK